MPLVKVADNWDALSDTEKIALFEGASYEQPEVNELRKLGKFKVVTYSKENEQIGCSIVGAPKVQIVLPKDLLNIKQVEDINKITVTQNITNKKSTKGSLLHFNNGYKDEYGTVWSADATNITISSDGKFGRCLDFNGNGAKLLSNEDISFGKGEFTIDFWIKAPNTQPTGYTTIVADRYNKFRVAKDGFTIDGASYIGQNWLDEAFDDNWHHIAFIRSSGKFILYIDGVKKQETSNQNSEDVNIATIGASHSSFANTYMKGKIDEFSAVPYVKWKENFTPPIQEYESPTEIKPSDIRYAFTIDKNKYYAFNNNDWEEIQTDEIPTKGNTKETVESIPKEKWKELITAKDTVVVSKLGIAYSIRQRYVEDTCNIDSLTLTIDQKGKLKRIHGYNVEFVDNESVEVTLPDAGSYKINYCLG